MFCNKCGKEIENESTFCPNCGSAVISGQNKKLQEFSNKAKNITQTLNDSETINSKVYITYALAVLECILPFMPWVKVPLYNALGSFFGASSDISSYSLFGYIGTIQNPTSFNSILILIFCIGTLVGIICNILYILKGLKNTCISHRLGITASLLMIIVSILFLITMGFMTWILKLIKITVIPLLLLIISTVNRFLIKTL